MDKEISNLYEEVIKSYILRLGELGQLDEGKKSLPHLKEGASFGIKLAIYLEKVIKDNFWQQADAVVKRYYDKLKEALKSLLANVGGGAKPVIIKSMELQVKLMLLPFEEFLNVLKAEVFKKWGIEHIWEDKSLAKLISFSQQVWEDFYQDFEKKELIWGEYELSRLIFQDVCWFLMCEDKQLWQDRFLKAQKQKEQREFDILMQLLKEGQLNVLKNIYDLMAPSLDKVKKWKIPFEEFYSELQKIDDILTELGDVPNKDVFALNFFGKIVQSLKGSKEEWWLLSSFKKMLGQTGGDAGLDDEQLKKLIYFVKKYHNEQLDNKW